MAFSLTLPKKLKSAGWKVKIQDKESRESPHLTIWLKSKKKWRVNLRNGEFMDRGGWGEIDDEVREIVNANWARLCDEWDARYGEINPVSSKEDGADA